jgi:hypothetical protein
MKGDTPNVDYLNLILSINPATLIDLVEKRLLSPLVVLKSSKFAKLYKLMNSEQKELLHKKCNVGFWVAKLSRDPSISKVLSKKIKENDI